MLEPTLPRPRRVRRPVEPTPPPTPATPAPNSAEALLADIILRIKPELVVDVVVVRERERARAEAEQQALMRVYKLTPLTAEDRKNPHIGELHQRLGIGRWTARALVTSGRIAYLETGEAKGFRVTERAVRDYEATAIPPVHHSSSPH